MRIGILWICFLFLSKIGTAQISLNMDLFGQYNRGDSRYSGCWGYIDAEGKEYALIGARTGLAVYSIDDDIEELDFISGPHSNWREVVVFQDHAYVTTEGASDTTGLQIIDLQYLPDSLHLVNTYTTTFTEGHIVQRDIYNETPYIYVSGTLETDGVHILDITNPIAPVEVGLYDPDYYIHDCFIKNDLMFVSAFSESVLEVVDISDRGNPQLIAQIDHFDSKTHSTWLTEDDRFLFLTSEFDGKPCRVYNIEDLGDVKEVAAFTADPKTLVHNPYVLGNYLFTSHNAAGIRMLDIHDPAVPVEVAYYDTYEPEEGGSRGLWSAFPYFPSGKVIGADRQTGLYVWTYNPPKAGRVYLSLLDSLTNDPIAGVEVVVLETGDTLKTDFEGRIKWGNVPGAYTMLIEQEVGSPVFQSVELESCDSLIVELLLNADFLNGNDDVYSKLPSLRYFPNPSNGELTLEAGMIEQGSNLLIYNALGQLMLNVCLSDEPRPTLNLQQLPKGTYHLLLLDPSGQAIAAGEVLLLH